MESKDTQSLVVAIGVVVVVAGALVVAFAWRAWVGLGVALRMF